MDSKMQKSLEQLASEVRKEREGEMEELKDEDLEAVDETFALAANRPDRIRDSMNLSKLLRISGLATLLVGTSILAGPAVAHAQDCPSPGPQGHENITLAPGSGGSGTLFGKTAAEMTHQRQHSGDYVKALLCRVSAANPGKNVMIIQHETYDGPDNLTGVTQDFETEIGGNKFDVFAFDTGSFTNDGDMGYENWAWSGIGWTRSEDKRTVTFSAP